ncbi:hypothetical protein B5E87_00195 [Massilimicrobiota sp. An142]|uniref:hypothetical protein n=1 Tax=Massilimicrobiota sp. An142 TaxID=1965564 RepID=UPI000B364F76|nr:hypothetical protein [Massilimicrobiota sp. An142]OUQ15026.1 hypothetical protein B5E87_00195 [Massilimicrobiota sp. An142]
MIDIQTISSNVEVITGADFEKIEIIAKKSKIEILAEIGKEESEIDSKYFDEISSIIEDLTIYKLNTLEVSGIQSQKFDIIQTTYRESTTYPSSLLKQISNIVERINPNSSIKSSGYATISAPLDL